MLDEVLKPNVQTNAEIPVITFTEDSLTSDEKLVQAVLDGDERAFAEIFERYRRHVAGVVGRFFRDRSDIEEFIQQSFTKAYFSLGKFRGGENRSFAAWITRIAINVCYDEFRRRQRHGSSFPGQDNGEEADYLESIIDHRSHSAESRLISAELAERVLASLDPQDRIAVTMMYSEEYSLDETAGAIGISTSSLKSRLFRCRNQLKMRFGYLYK